MEELNKENVENTSNNISLEDDGLFGSNNANIKHKKKRKPFFIGKKKRVLQISIASVSLVVIIFSIVILIRISDATKVCKELLKKDFYSREVLVEQMRMDGFNNFEIKNAIKIAKVNFEDNMNKKLYKAIEQPSKILCKDDLKKELIIAGFREEDIDNMFLTLNWDVFYRTYISNYFKNHDGNIKKDEFLAELSKNGFNQQDILFFSSLSEWDVLGQKYVKKYFEDTAIPSKNSVRNYLKSYGYNDKEIDNIFLSVDWNKQALNCITNYLKQDEEHVTISSSNEIEVTKYLFDKVLKEMGFSESEIQYAKDNYNFSDSIDKIISNYAKENKILSKTELEKTLKNKQFSESDIKEAFANVGWKNYAASTTIEYLSQNKANKNEALKFLKDNGYTEEEIAYVETKTVWSTYASKALMFMLEGNNKTKDELFNTLKDYGYSESDILSAKTNTSLNQYAYNYLMNSQSKDSLAIIGKTEIKAILDNAGYSNEYSYVVGRFDWNEQASNYLNSLLTTYLNGPSVYNFDDIVATMQNKGFSQTPDIANAFTKYDFNNFASKWATAFFNTADALNKKKFKESFDSMKVTNVKSLSDKVGGIERYADWTSFAKQVIEGYTNVSLATQKLQEYGYSESEIIVAIEETFPNSQ